MQVDPLKMPETTKLLRTWLYAVFPGLNRLARLRAAWGCRGEKDGWLASRAFDLLRTASRSQWLDDKTWLDLELPSFFAALDTTASPVGSQMLYRQLREYQYDSGEMTRRYEVYDAFKTDAALREECQLALIGLDSDPAAHIADLLLGPVPELPNYRALALLLAGVSLTMLVLVITTSLSPWLWVAVLVVNVVLLGKMDTRISRDAGSLLACWQMLKVADRLSSIRTETRVGLLRQLQAGQAERSDLGRQIKWFALASGEGTLLGGLATVLSLCFLLKLITYLLTMDKIAALRPQCKATFELVGSVDASIAIANFLYRMPEHCRPTVSAERLIAFEAMYHPLLSNSVKCSVRLHNRSALVTGSNMTGKTTFVKAVALNIIFGNTLGVCLASVATIPASAVMTSIRTDHSVESGRSRYSAEVETIIRMLESQAREECHVFVLDEPFSGTNTVERIAIARAVLNAMGQRAQVLVTTHDVELQYLLVDSFDLFHFREDPDVDRFFDYKLRSGASTERNAIKVLGRMGFPSAILDGAIDHIEQQFKQ